MEKATQVIIGYNKNFLKKRHKTKTSGVRHSLTPFLVPENGNVNMRKTPKTF